MELTIKDYFELERLGLNIEEAQKIAKECINIRELEYKLYFGCYTKNTKLKQVL